MEHIDKVVYINLDRRADRRAEIEAELDRLGVPAEKRLRFPAIASPWGWVGCTKSHCEVVRMAKAAGWSRVWILEDDWTATVSPEVFHESLTALVAGQPPAWDQTCELQNISEHPVPQGERDTVNVKQSQGWQTRQTMHSGDIVATRMSAWDVLMVSSYVQASEPVPECPLVRRGYNIQTASSYIVNGSFFDRLLENLEEAVRGAESGGNHWDCINDQYWKRLQADRSTTWLYFSPALGKQRASHSDLTGRYEDYGV